MVSQLGHSRLISIVFWILYDSTCSPFERQILRYVQLIKLNSGINENNDASDYIQF